VPYTVPDLVVFKPVDGGIASLHWSGPKTLDQSDPGITIPAGRFVNYPCDIWNVIRAPQLNGKSLETQSVQLSFEMSYQTHLLFFDIDRHYTSPTYRGSATPYGFQWLEGEVVLPK
jgi:hypothetical protein